MNMIWCTGMSSPAICWWPGTDSDHPEHVYLTDFGLTKKSLSLTGLTSVGEFVGTLDYVAPEQIAGRPVDGRCDLYSLACVVYEALAGGPPFQRDDSMELLWAHQYDQPPALSERRPDAPPGMDEVVARALAKVPEDRYDSCLEFVAALRSTVQGVEPEPAAHPPTQVDPGVDGAAQHPGAVPDRLSGPAGLRPSARLVLQVGPGAGTVSRWAGPGS